MKKYSLFLPLFLAYINCSAQSAYNLPPKSFYEKATVGMINFNQLQIKDMTVANDSIFYYLNGSYSALPLEKINYIRVKSGNKAGNGALIGGGAMLLISISAMIQVSADPNYELKNDAELRAGLFTLGGAALGAMIGATVQKETSYYVHMKKAHQRKDE